MLHPPVILPGGAAKKAFFASAPPQRESGRWRTDELRFRSRAALLFRTEVVVQLTKDGFLVADEGGVEAGEGAVFGGAPLHFGEG